PPLSSRTPSGRLCPPRLPPTRRRRARTPAHDPATPSRSAGGRDHGRRLGGGGGGGHEARRERLPRQARQVPGHRAGGGARGARPPRARAHGGALPERAPLLAPRGEPAPPRAARALPPRRHHGRER